ncbi:3-hydroxyacyl-CoA dehydrogenase NAD-binding domain-containing protein [Polyangium sp. 15x6]|uniref:3-hydroxyacyl-CoA dehydrogenase family protein n=1 Tax=Polyangium sp. 15x6 TaxID=3042687 RepID=UPI00249CEFBE|nr:3-hydroxyacyl-CoA dehydrogenase NAD-binding domain-containing protein [Polyangium sp. 15x6]MDI3287047.1 3-hydroxyacyl-CoA dehydrogenase NAD-binding domain-containing protein [Polyangium sp. 15x6]
MSIEIVGVVGAGVMGVGVAQNLAQTGHRVILVDSSEERLRRVGDEIRQGIRSQLLLKKVKLAESPEQILERVTRTSDFAKLAEAQFVIENVTESWEIKKPVWEQLDRICPAETVLAANTSAISITRFGSVTRRPDKVVGIHFMNPVPMKRMVEVIRGFHTSNETIETTRAVLGAMGKELVVVEDSPGFVSNRVLMLTINEAIFLVQDRVASAEDVDRIFKGCFGHPMGPLETGDLIGLDTILLSLEVLYESFNDSKYRPCPLLRKMVDAGLHGRKSGRGFYHYA